MIGRAAIAAAAARITPHLRRTPVLALEAGALGPDLPVMLKLEQLQHTGSFKVRGALNTMLAAGGLPEAGVVAASGGNHGAAVAWAAARLGVTATIFVPRILADEVKLARMRGFGAQIRLADGTVGEVMEQFAAHAEATGALPVHPFDGPATLAGQGTLGAEIEEDAPDLDALLVSVGGGGLIGGIAAWYEGRTRVIAVESEGTASYAASLSAGGPAEITPRGIAASALGAPRLGPMAAEILRARDVESVVVSDDDITRAARRLWEATRLVVEPGAATALAAFTTGTVAAGRIGVLLCGGNAAPDWFL